MTAQNYYTSSDTPDYEFCKTPKALFKSKELKKLSDGAKLLYISILNRLTLSMKNGIEDEQGRTIVYYSLEDVCEDLGCSRTKAVKLFAELDIKKGAGLIERKRLGLCKTSIIFVLKPEFEKTNTKGSEAEKATCPPSLENVEKSPDEDIFFDSVSKVDHPDAKELTTPIFKNDASGLLKAENQECKKLDCNNNKINKNKLNNNYLSKHKINLSTAQCSDKNNNSPCISDGWKERAEEYKKIIHKNISYDILCYSIRREWLDEIVSIMTDALCAGGSEKINNVIYPPEAVRERLLSLESDHIEYVWECMRENSKPLKNVRAYLLTALYRAPETMISWYDAKVRSDMSVLTTGANIKRAP